MANFFTIWEEIRNEEIDDISFSLGFLHKVVAVQEVIENGSDIEIQRVINMLQTLEFSQLAELAIVVGKDLVLDASDVPCFSKFENGAFRLNELLVFAPEGLSFSDIGYQLVKASKTSAKIKYGENHSKLAAMMNLVTISGHRPAFTKNTALGSYITTIPMEQRAAIVKKTLLQNKFVQFFLAEICSHDRLRYLDIVPCLSVSTAYRRRTSVKQLIEFVLAESAYADYLGAIDWEV